MKMTKREVVNGKIIITTERKFLWFKIIEQFEALEKEFPPGYWQWLKLPDRTLVNDSLSFQLDVWNKIYK